MRKNEEDKNRWMHLLGEILTSGAIGLAVSCLCLLCAAVLIAGGMVGRGGERGIVCLCCLIGGAAGGVILRRRARGTAATCICAGAAQFLFLFAVGSVVNHGACAWRNGWLLLGACLVGSCAGFLHFSGKGKGKRRHRRRS